MCYIYYCDNQSMPYLQLLTIIYLMIYNG